MYELDCRGIIPGCDRVIRAESHAEVVRRAVAQVRTLGVEHVSPTLLEAFRDRVVETRH